MRKNYFFFFLSDFVRILSEKFFRLLAKKLHEFAKTTFYVSTVTICGWKFFFLSFESFRIFCRNLWHGSSKIYPSVHSKNCGLNRFFVFLFRFFFEFWAKNFLDFRPKNFKKLWKLTSACPQEQLEALNFFKKIWIVLDFPQKPLAWFSKFYLRVQSKKCGKNSSFLFSFQNFFSNFERKFFRLLAKKLQQFFKNYLLRVQRNNLWLEFFFVKFWIVSYFLQKLLAWFSKFYLRVQSKNCGRNSFLIFLFRIFSDFEWKIFQTFGQKTSWSCQNYLLRVQRNTLWI